MKNVLKIKNPSTGEFEPIAAISGADGKPGKDGQGVPTGGTVGQVLKKTGSGDYETGWSDSAGDSEKLGGVAAAQYARKNDVPAHNLLDNSDFTNPVNQRGATTATLGKYFIDRWSTEPYPSGPSITIDSNGLTLLPTTISTAGIYQILPDYENRKGKVHTFAICVNNVWKCVSFTMGNFGVGYLIHGLSFFSVDNRNILIRNNASDTPAPITIQRVALYEGSYDASTLPAYQPKGFAAELAECMRYFERLGGTSSQILGNAVFAKAGAKSVIISIKYSPKRLSNPTLSFSNPSEYRMLQKDAVNASTISACSITSFDDIATETPFAYFRVNLADALQSDSWLILQRADGAKGAYIDVNADM